MIYIGIIVLAQKLMLAIQDATNSIQTLSKENNNIPNAMLENMTIFNWLLTIVSLICLLFHLTGRLPSSFSESLVKISLSNKNIHE